MVVQLVEVHSARRRQVLEQPGKLGPLVQLPTLDSARNRRSVLVQPFRAISLVSGAADLAVEGAGPQLLRRAVLALAWVEDLLAEERLAVVASVAGPVLARLQGLHSVLERVRLAEERPLRLGPLRPLGSEARARRVRLVAQLPRRASEAVWVAAWVVELWAVRRVASAGSEEPPEERSACSQLPAHSGLLPRPLPSAHPRRAARSAVAVEPLASPLRPDRVPSAAVLLEHLRPEPPGPLVQHRLGVALSALQEASEVGLAADWVVSVRDSSSRAALVTHHSSL